MKRWFLSDGIFIFTIYGVFSLIYLGFSCGIPAEQKVPRVKMIYTKDTVTNLCFATQGWDGYDGNGFNMKGMICVPCDSLKNVKIYLTENTK